MDNRKDKRFREDNRVLIKDTGEAPGTGGSVGINAHTYDISVSGARICSKLDFPVGYVIKIVLDLERTNQSFSVDGEVIWSRRSKNGKEFDIGVEFLHSISDTILFLIKHFYGKKVGIPSQVS
jgi:hypothetical protein